MENILMCSDILYLVPQDHENSGSNQVDTIQTHYNMFTIPSKLVTEVNLTGVQKWFPLPGHYHICNKTTNKALFSGLILIIQQRNFQQQDGMIIMKVLKKKLQLASGKRSKSRIRTQIEFTNKNSLLNKINYK